MAYLRTLVRGTGTGMKNKMGEARFVLKHALRMRNLVLEANGDIMGLNGTKVGTLGKVEWISKTEISYTFKPTNYDKFVNGAIDTGSL